MVWFLNAEQWVHPSEQAHGLVLWNTVQYEIFIKFCFKVGLRYDQKSNHIWFVVLTIFLKKNWKGWGFFEEKKKGENIGLFTANIRGLDAHWSMCMMIHHLKIEADCIILSSQFHPDWCFKKMWADSRIFNDFLLNHQYAFIRKSLNA